MNVLDIASNEVIFKIDVSISIKRIDIFLFINQFNVFHDNFWIATKKSIKNTFIFLRTCWDLS